MNALRGVVFILASSLLTSACDGGNNDKAKPGNQSRADAMPGGDGGLTGLGEALGNPGTWDNSRPPKEQCQTISNAICAREATCLMRPADVACRADIAKAGLCDRTTETQPQIASCHRDLSNVSCASLFPGNQFDMPNSCIGVFVAEPTPSELQCEALAKATCERIVACATNPPAAADVAATVAFCTENFVLNFECFAVTSVSASYATCLEQTQALTCERLRADDDEPLVPACVGVLNY